ncbi:MAG: hypothetical protein M1480_13855 [Bacteroidetes bacterium]|nr:hypothetical protein [Bacteroidota bacterium]
MSRIIDITLTCSLCRYEFPYKLYCSIAGDEPGNLELVLTDKINVAVCPICIVSVKLNSPLMYSNISKNFAVWWEPYYDPQIDKENELLIKMGRGKNFLSEAPRIRDWQEFKNTIMKYESGELKGIPFTNSNPKKKADGLFKRIFKK